MEKFADHPVAVCNDPYGNGNIVAKLTHVLPGAPADNNGNDKGWYNHSYAQRPPKHAPAYILAAKKKCAGFPFFESGWGCCKFVHLA